MIPVQVQQLSSTALTTFFSDDKFDKIEVEEDKNTLMPYNEEWDEEEIIDTDTDNEDTLMYTNEPPPPVDITTIVTTHH